MKLATGAACALFFCGTAMAAVPATSPSFLDLYYTPDSKIGGSSSADGKGYGGRAELRLGGAWALEGELSKDKLTREVAPGASVDEDLESARAGIGLLAANGSGLLVQWHNFRTTDSFGDEDSLPGWGVHSKVAGALSPRFHAYTTFGYEQFKDNGAKAKGFEYSGGGIFDLGEATGVFLDYRVTDLKTNDSPSIRLKYTTLRVGLRLAF